jgi:hypothetical protein
MAKITSLATLKTAIGDYLARDDLTTFYDNFIEAAENKLYRTLNLRNEETALSVSISSGVAAVPSDFKALKFAYYDNTPAQLLQWTTITELYRDYPNRSDSTIPYVISREGSNFVFGPNAQDGTLKGIYFAKKASILDTDPSWYVTNAPEVLLYGALLEAQPFIFNDQKIAVWQSFFNDAVSSLLEEEANANESPGSLVQRTS